MDNKNYELLMQKTKEQNEDERLTIINTQIEEILSKAPNKMHALEALICKFEAETNIGPYFSALTISYAVLMGAVAIMPDDLMLFLLAGVLVIMSLVLAGIAAKTNKTNKHKAFVLQALKFRYEKEKYIVNNLKESVDVIEGITREEK